VIARVIGANRVTIGPEAIVTAIAAVTVIVSGKVCATPRTATGPRASAVMAIAIACTATVRASRDVNIRAIRAGTPVRAMRIETLRQAPRPQRIARRRKRPRRGRTPRPELCAMIRLRATATRNAAIATGANVAAGAAAVEAVAGGMCLSKPTAM